MGGVAGGEEVAGVGEGDELDGGAEERSRGWIWFGVALARNGHAVFRIVEVRMGRESTTVRIEREDRGAGSAGRGDAKSPLQDQGENLGA